MITTAIVGWLNRHARAGVWGLWIAALVWRILLVAFSPWSFGYVWDLYHEAIQRLYASGRLPASTDCWECWQPPLLFLASWPLYAIGRIAYPASPWPDDYALRAVGLIPLAAGIACLWYTFRLIRLLGHRGAWLVLGFGLAAALPCLFFSTYGIEPDILLAALLIAFLYYLTRWHLSRPSPTIVDAGRLGLLAGLAAETKYSGLTAMVVGAGLITIDAVRGRARPRSLILVAVFILVTGAIGSWKYVDNMRRYGTPFFANGDAGAGFSLSQRIFHTHYEFVTFRLGALTSLTRADAPDGMLTDLPVYRSIWTTLHGLAWGDMGFFTNPTRHGTRYPFYQNRHIPPWLASAVLVLGIVPDLLAIVGFVITARRHAYLPITIMCVVGWLLYFQYLLSQQIWALKAKYLLFLVPAYALYTVVGLRWVKAAAPDWISAALVSALVALIVLSNAYLLFFAIG
jgi:hypothetical protein